MVNCHIVCPLYVMWILRRCVLNVVNGRRYGWRYIRFNLVSFMKLFHCDDKLWELLLCSRRYCSVLTFF